MIYRFDCRDALWFGRHVSDFGRKTRIECLTRWFGHPRDPASADFEMALGTQGMSWAIPCGPGDLESAVDIRLRMSGHRRSRAVRRIGFRHHQLQATEHKFAYFFLRIAPPASGCRSLNPKRCANDELQRCASALLDH